MAKLPSDQPITPLTTLLNNFVTYRLKSWALSLKVDFHRVQVQVSLDIIYIFSTQ